MRSETSLICRPQRHFSAVAPHNPGREVQRQETVFHTRARPSYGGELRWATRRLRLLVNSVSTGIRYIGTSRSKSAGPGSLQNESCAGKGSTSVLKRSGKGASTRIQPPSAWYARFIALRLAVDVEGRRAHPCLNLPRGCRAALKTRKTVSLPNLLHSNPGIRSY